MVLSTTTYILDPSQMTCIEPDLIIAYERTYGAVEIFNWGATIVGKVIEQEWNAMPVSQYETLRSYKDAGTTLRFYPTNTASTDAYNVRILNLEGRYIQGFGIATSGTAVWRGDCKLTLLVESTAT